MPLGFLWLCLTSGKFPGEKCALCFCSGLFIYLFSIMINCTVFGEIEMVHGKMKEQQSERTQYGKQLEHLKIKGGNRNDKGFLKELIYSSSSRQTKLSSRSHGERQNDNMHAQSLSVWWIGIQPPPQRSIVVLSELFCLSVPQLPNLQKQTSKYKHIPHKGLFICQCSEHFSSFNCHNAVNAIITISTLQKRKLRHRGANRQPQGHTASQWQRWNQS